MQESTTQVTQPQPDAPQPQAADGPATKAAPAKPAAKAKATQPEAPLHPNPRIAKALAEHARAGDKYKSAAELCRSIGINDKATQRAVRQVLRDAGLGVGRGRTYANITTPKVVKAAKANTARARKAAKAGKADAKA